MYPDLNNLQRSWPNWLERSKNQSINQSINLQLLKEASSQTTANIVIEPSAGRHLLQQLAVQYTSATSHL